MVRQAEASECGLACLAMIATWHGYDIDLSSLRRGFPVSLRGSTLRDLIDIGAKLGLGGRAMRCELGDLHKVRTPCIVHWDFKHFVVLSKVRAGRAWLHDPAVGVRVVKIEELSLSFTGVVLEFTLLDSFEKKKETERLRLNKLWRWSPETRSALFQGLLLSFLLELFVLLSPFYMQLVVDEAIVKGDRDLLLVLAFAFALVTLFNAAASALRGIVLQFLANVMSFDMGARVFHQLMRLPLDFFQKRNLGDLFQRFRSLEPIKQFIVSGGIATVIDGVLSIVTCILMLFYSAKLGSIVIAVVAGYVLTRVAVYSVGRRYMMDSLVTESREQSQFLETLRSAQTVKVTSGEANRETEWRNLYAAKINAVIKSGNLGIFYQSASTVLTGLSDVVIIYLAAKDAMNGVLTIGVITAFLAYKGQFMTRMISLTDQLMQFKLLDVHLDRVSDIVFARPEEGMDQIRNVRQELQGSVEAKNLFFRYSPTDPLVIDELNVRIRAGEFVAIVGPSGEGKTTLLKLLLGLYQPDSGEVLLDDLPMLQHGLSNVRGQLGVVMQDDHLLSGTIADNIGLFDDNLIMERVRQCARMAQVDGEIMAMPMQYNSIVADMGSALSSGQKQRVLIARALYRNPKILVMDEGTAHLDSACEQRLISVLRDLPMTRIVIAHSRTMADASDRVLELRKGKLSEHSNFARSGRLVAAASGSGQRKEFHSETIEEGEI